jgi:hypothetical protein
VGPGRHGVQPGPLGVGGLQCNPVRVYVLWARCYDSHRVLGVYRSATRALAMADVGDRVEVRLATKRLISWARSADSVEERDSFAREMLGVVADGVRYWQHNVSEVTLSE